MKKNLGILCLLSISFGGLCAEEVGDLPPAKTEVSAPVMQPLTLPADDEIVDEGEEELTSEQLLGRTVEEDTAELAMLEEETASLGEELETDLERDYE